MRPVALPRVATTIGALWKYGRIMVIFLLLLGLAGPWFKWDHDPEASRTVIGADLIFDPLDVGTEFLSWPLSALFLLTVLRLIPSRVNESKLIRLLERLTTGITPIPLIVIINDTLRGQHATYIFLWGFWLVMIGVYLAPLNILVEMRSTLQQGQKWPWWAWLLAASTTISIAIWVGLLSRASMFGVP